MQLLLVLSAVFLVASGQIASDTTRVICYYGSWAHGYTGLGQFLPSDIDPTLCTHYIYSFVDIDREGGLLTKDESEQGGISAFVALKGKNPNLKLMVAVGGYTSGSVNFSSVAASEELRKRFASNAVDFLKRYGFDGLDIDWEFPAQREGSTPADKENFVLFVKALKEAFEPHGYILSAAVSATQYSIDLSYNVKALNDLLDFINVMTYDLHGGWEQVTGANAPLHPQPSDSAGAVTVDSSIKAWLANGASAAKLNLGLGLYGAAFTLASAGASGTGAATGAAAHAGPHTGAASSWNYIEICSDIKNDPASWKIVNNDNSYVYGVKGTLWIGYDNEDTLRAKGAFAKSMGLGGLMFWAMHGDDFRGNCGEKYALTKAAIAGYNA